MQKIPQHGSMSKKKMHSNRNLLITIHQKLIFLFFLQFDSNAQFQMVHDSDKIKINILCTQLKTDLSLIIAPKHLRRWVFDRFLSCNIPA